MSTRVEVGGPSQIVARRLGISGAESPVSDVAPEIHPGIIIECDRPEFAFLGGERLATGSGLLAAGGAGLRSYIRLSNPAFSGLLVVVEECFSAHTSGDSASLRISPFASIAGETVAAGAQSRDRRNPTAPAATVTNNNTISLAALGGTFFAFMQAITADIGPNNLDSWYYGRPIILAPGTSIAMVASGDNSSMLGTFTWRERRLGRYEQ